MIEESKIRKMCLSLKLCLSGLFMIALGLVIAVLSFGNRWDMFGISCLLLFIGILVYVMVPVYIRTTTEGIYCKKIVNNPIQQPILWSDIENIYKAGESAGRGGTNYYVYVVVKDFQKYFPKMRMKNNNLATPILRLSVSNRSNLEQNLRELWRKYE
ncbi:hypothetical protein [Lactococcus allomyrinae]|uniref:Uncharacterized protein n=1 Tax=Lactococcus allomyrinae TaxID=2419773 RepID=A0A387BAA9_9LACT|nr:hypothetical protein [Lactococcus allomyrinae]AYG00795.1 hypothetical protein D7I46_06615 [Lactococcus allomyrinae]